MDLSGYSVIHTGKNNGLLRERRVILGLTQQQVAEKAKVGLQAYQKFEGGQRNIKTASFQVACRVIEALEMDITKFYHDDYEIGEKQFRDKEGWKYEKTGKLVTEDVE